MKNNNSNQLSGSQAKGVPNDRSLAQESKEAYETYGNTFT
jgi:hypothetical protein